jgi:hypothetical protein
VADLNPTAKQSAAVDATVRYEHLAFGIGAVIAFHTPLSTVRNWAITRRLFSIRLRGRPNKAAMVAAIPPTPNRNELAGSGAITTIGATKSGKGKPLGVLIPK